MRSAEARRRSYGLVVNASALARWRHKEQPPSVFSVAWRMACPRLYSAPQNSVAFAAAAAQNGVAGSSTLANASPAR